MEAVLRDIAYYVGLTAEAIAILIVALAIVEAAINIARLALTRRSDGARRREVWLEFARWLVAALTFQLAADIVNTSFAPSWEEVGRLAVVAAIRTFLSYFLDREVENTIRIQGADGAAATARGSRETQIKGVQ